MQVASTKTPENLVCKNIGENSFTVLLSSECRWPNVNEAKLCQVCQRQKFANHAAGVQFYHIAKWLIYRFVQKGIENIARIANAVPVTLYSRVTVNVEIVVLNCQKCNL